MQTNKTDIAQDGYLAVIPARGGSKRLPGKNTRLLGGEPLLVHSIKFALSLPCRPRGCFNRLLGNCKCSALWC